MEQWEGQTLIHYITVVLTQILHYYYRFGGAMGGANSNTLYYCMLTQILHYYYRFGGAMGGANSNTLYYCMMDTNIALLLSVWWSNGMGQL